MSRLLGRLVVAALAFSAPALAQQASSYVAPATVDTVNAAIAAATPSACPAPAADTLVANAGSQPVCMTRPDATRPTQVQSTRTTTNTDGTFSAAWPVAFGNSPTYGHAEVLGGTQPYSCDVLTINAGGATGKCYALVPTTLPGTLTAIVGVVISPVANPGGGLTVMVVGRQ